ncbi:hypothetical protein MBLNU230_g4044t1 [Neophaeotheca triangularis]
MPAKQHHPTTRAWLHGLSNPEDVRASRSDQPNYWLSHPQNLISTTNIHNISLGTGASIYQSNILPAIETAQDEVILVTCFWARSRTLDMLNASLRKLSSKAQSEGRHIRIRIFFSSSSLFQKLLHTSSLAGKVYGPETWQKKFGLPSKDEIPGLDLSIKSIFLLPFSVMHPKFVVVDRERVFLPSCNVSWEDWFEGCVELSGKITEQFLMFWSKFWNGDQEQIACEDRSSNERDTSYLQSNSVREAAGELLAQENLTLSGVSAVFLPSPHHRNPRFVLPWQECPPPPPTPLNVFILAALNGAQTHIRVQTPNVTAPPVLSALLSALRRGVDVEIVTSERLMILEQLILAQSTTPRCVKKLIKRHSALRDQWNQSSQTGDFAELEAGSLLKPGRLHVSYYVPRSYQGEKPPPEPVQSHFKCMIVDHDITILGSGNMDRPSWYSSQELGVAFMDSGFATTVEQAARAALEGRLKLVHDSK